MKQGSSLIERPIIQVSIFNSGPKADIDIKLKQTNLMNKLISNQNFRIYVCILTSFSIFGVLYH